MTQDWLGSAVLFNPTELVIHKEDLALAALIDLSDSGKFHIAASK
jgi:hypothetical protein